MALETGGPYLAGKLLLAMPTLGDPRFHKAVIFLCAHDENGAMGLVVNHPLAEASFSDFLAQLKIISDIHVDVPVMEGGPVEGQRGFLLHSSEFAQEDTVRIDSSFSVTGTIEALKSVAAGKGPKQMLFILGYAGWQAGQLAAEIRDNAWLVCAPDHGIVFHAPAEERWARALRTLGIDPGQLNNETGHA